MAPGYFLVQINSTDLRWARYTSFSSNAGRIAALPKADWPVEFC